VDHLAAHRALHFRFGIVAALEQVGVRLIRASKDVVFF
jgi:hypothetical protein